MRADLAVADVGSYLAAPRLVESVAGSLRGTVVLGGC